jgi:hypothetical protein
MHVAIVSAQDDLHALIVQRALQLYPDVQCDVIQCDRIASSGALNWSNAANRAMECRVPVKDGPSVVVHELDVIWWRRIGYPQQLPGSITDPAHIDLINNDCRVALAGLLLEQFQGVWINHPIKTQLANNKLLQLAAARRAGFRVPRTLVSQDPAEIREFYDSLGGQVVVKPVSGTSQAALLTIKLASEHLQHVDSLALCPAIYQEYIPGERHLRVQCFGDEVYAVVIESKNLDWRHDVDVPIIQTELPETTRRKLHNLLESLELRMGIVDLKLPADGGDPVWFEINPQGQFLFVQGLTALDLTSAFASFIYREGRKAPALDRDEKRP